MALYGHELYPKICTNTNILLSIQTISPNHMSTLICNCFDGHQDESCGKCIQCVDTWTTEPGVPRQHESVLNLISPLLISRTKGLLLEWLLILPTLQGTHQRLERVMMSIFVSEGAVQTGPQEVRKHTLHLALHGCNLLICVLPQNINNPANSRARVVCHKRIISLQVFALRFISQFHIRFHIQDALRQNNMRW